MAQTNKPIRIAPDQYNQLRALARKNKYRLNMGKLASMAIDRGLAQLIREVSR
jgi:hypothetical protein